MSKQLYDDRWFFPTLDRPGVVRRWVIGTIALIVFGTVNSDAPQWENHFFSLCRSWGVLSFLLFLFFCYGAKWLRQLPIGWAWVTWIVTTIMFSLIMGSFELVTNFSIPTFQFLALRLFRDIFFVLILLFLFDGQHRRGSASWVKTRLDTLQTRMRPHFLFNTLNNLAEIVRTDPDQAEEALLDFADLSRAMLQQAPEIKASDEKAHAEAYIRLEKIRLHERLNVEWEWDVQPNTRMPTLLLQPLIENAIKYGVEPKKSEKPILIKGFEDKHSLCLIIKNPLSSQASDSGTGITLPTLKERLEWLYPNSHWFRTSITETYFEIIIKIPLKHI